MSRNEKQFAHLAARDRNIVTIAVSPQHLQTVGLAREVADVYGLSGVGKSEIAMAKRAYNGPGTDQKVPASSCHHLAIGGRL
jgi:hypothetical protein